MAFLDLSNSRIEKVAPLVSFAVVLLKSRYCGIFFRADRGKG